MTTGIKRYLRENDNDIILPYTVSSAVLMDDGVTPLSEALEGIGSTSVTPAIDFGMNNVIKNTGKVSVSPKFTIKGKTVINLLGKDGNCEDVSKWNLYQATSSLDSTNKVFGSSAIKITMTASAWGNINKTSLPSTVDITKYYCLSAYTKNGNATNIRIRKDNVGGGVQKFTEYVTDTTKFTRSFVKIQPSDLNLSNYIYIDVAGPNGTYAYVDGIMLEEITAAQYNDALFVPSPYVDSYSCLQNPYIEIKHDNLVRNGNGEEGVGWWENAGTPSSFIFEGGYFKVVDDDPAAKEGVQQFIKVNPNTTYNINAILKCGTMAHMKLVLIELVNGIDNQSNRKDISVNSVTDTTLNAQITTGNEGYIICVKIMGDNTYDSETGSIYFKKVILTEGTTPPTEYKSQRIERTVIEGLFPDGDNFTYENGEVSGLLNWKHKTLFGKDYDWQYADLDYTGFKRIVGNSVCKGVISSNNGNGNSMLTKYDGKILKWDSTVTSASDLFQQGASIPETLHISVADTDTGWAEAISPNADEVKAFMNGWKAIYNNGTRYCAWLSVVDGSVPSGATKSVVSVASVNSTLVTVASTEGIVNGDTVGIVRNGTSLGFASTISSLTATTFVVTGNWSMLVGDILVKLDNPAVTAPLLHWCKNNIAPGYEGYQLHYKLATPEPITDVNTRIEGDIPKFDVGDNYLTIDSGIVLGEVANPILTGDNLYYNINTRYNIAESSNPLKNKVEIFNSIYKNEVLDTTWDKSINGYTLYFPYGNVRTVTLKANFDTSAQYTVDYKILATQAPAVGSISCSYSKDIVSVIDDLKEEIDSRQAHDSILDTIVDLSVYEKIAMGSAMLLPWIRANGTQLFVGFNLAMNNKKVKSRLTINKVSIICNGVDVTNKFAFSTISSAGNNISINYWTTDTTVYTNITTYGVYGTITLTADCKEVI